jgi:transposase
MNAKSAHGCLLHSRHALRRKAVTDMFHQRSVTEFLVKEGNSAEVIYERLHGVIWRDLHGSSSVGRWVKHFKDRNTDIAGQPLCGRPRTAVTEGNKQKVDELIRQDRRITVRDCSAAWSGAPCGPGHDGNFGILENLFPLGSPSDLADNSR